MNNYDLLFFKINENKKKNNISFNYSKMVYYYHHSNKFY